MSSDKTSQLNCKKFVGCFGSQRTLMGAPNHKKFIVPFEYQRALTRTLDFKKFLANWEVKKKQKELPIVMSIRVDWRVNEL